MTVTVLFEAVSRGKNMFNFIMEWDHESPKDSKFIFIIRWNASGGLIKLEFEARVESRLIHFLI